MLHEKEIKSTIESRKVMWLGQLSGVFQSCKNLVYCYSLLGEQDLKIHHKIGMLLSLLKHNV